MAQNPENYSLKDIIERCGDSIVFHFNKVVDEVPTSVQGPQKLAQSIGTNKVLASRVLKALRATDSLTALHRMPGPESLRKFINAAKSYGVSKVAIQEALESIDQFERVLKVELGDRHALDAVLSSWVPEARREFELRRKQTSFRSMSQLKGIVAEIYADTGIMYPSECGQKIDVVWIKRLIGLRRLRPNTKVWLTTIRSANASDKRVAESLDGRPIDDLGSAVLPEYSTIESNSVQVERDGEQIHYFLADQGYGSRSSQDLCTVEVNRGELARYVDPALNRRAWFSSGLEIPAQRHQFDLFIHRDLFNGARPELKLFDTNLKGIIDVNGSSEYTQEYDLSEVIEDLGTGINQARSSIVPKYHALIQHVLQELEYEERDLVGYRCLIEYPIYGCQATMIFPTIASSNDSQGK